MNENILIKDYLIKNMNKVNNTISKFMLVFLLLCPGLLVANLAELTNFSTGLILELCLVFFVLSIFPLLFCMYSYSETWNRRVCLICLELIVCVLSLNNIVELNLVFLLVPMVSLLYMNKTIFTDTAKLCFFPLLVVKLHQCYFVYRQIIASNPDLSSSYKSLSIFTPEFKSSYVSLARLGFEYIIAVGVLYLVERNTMDMIVSGYYADKSAENEKESNSTNKIDRGTEEIYNTKGLFLEVNQTIQSLIRGKNVAFSVDVDYALPVKLSGDKKKILTAMVSIISEFVQQSDGEKVELEVTYDKGINPRKGQNITVLCKIKCTKDFSGNIKNGTALGYTLAKKLLQEMNGIILDKKNRGDAWETNQVMALQQKVADETTIMHAKEEFRQEQKELISDSQKKAQDILLARKVKALIVDDSQDNQRLVASILKSYGMVTRCVSTGEEAIEQVKTKAYDFVIIDHMMPIKGGIQTAREIRQMDEPYFELLPLLAMSSSVTEESKQMFYNSGFAEVISKPIKERELRQAMSNCMFL